VCESKKLEILPKFTLAGRRSRKGKNMFMIIMFSTCGNGYICTWYNLILTKRPKVRFTITILLLRKQRCGEGLETCPKAWNL